MTYTKLDQEAARARLVKAAKGAQIKWIAGVKFNATILVTLNQALPNAGGGLTPIGESQWLETAKFLRDRVIRKLVGNSAFRAGKRIPWATTKEGDGVVRHHFHVLVRLPDDVTPQQLERVVQDVAQKLPWVREKIGVKSIESGESDVEDFVRYLNKEGLDAFEPRASTNCFDID